ncbi:MAG: outer membrane protein assembly factor BamD [Planctomycetota bacterium]
MFLLQKRLATAAALLGTVVGSYRAGAQTPRARTLTYDSQRKEWVELPPPPTGTAAGDLYEIRRLNAEEKYRNALSGVQRFIKQYSKSDSLYPEVLLTQAEALVGRKQFDKAHTILQSFLGEFGGMAITSEALRLEFVVAEAYLSGVKRTVWRVFRVSGVDEAYKILDQIAADYPDSRLAEPAIKVKGDHLFRVGEHALAELEYARLLRDYPKSRYHQYALRRAADSALASFAGVEFDEAAIIEAEERFNDYRTRYRAEADRDGVGQVLDTIHEMRAEKDFRIGEYYERTDHLSSAVFYYKSVRENQRNTIAAARATRRLELLGALAPASSSESGSVTP